MTTTSAAEAASHFDFFMTLTPFLADWSDQHLSDCNECDERSQWRQRRNHCQFGVSCRADFLASKSSLLRLETWSRGLHAIDGCELDFIIDVSFKFFR